MGLCQYGCGKEALYLSRGTTPCCSPHHSQCEAVKNKNSASQTKDELKIQCIHCGKSFRRGAALQKHEAACHLNPVNIENQQTLNYVCENCGKPHNGLFATGRFCCRKCSNSFSLKQKRNERYAKVRETFAKRRIFFERVCDYCQKPFFTMKESQRFCSAECSKSAPKSEKTLTKMSNAARRNAIRRHQKGDTNFGWQTRKGSSYPERYFESVFKRRNIVFERERKFGRWFADFVFEKEKLIIEIDGRQHQKPERIESDKRKDAYISSLGYKVIRVPWHNPRTKQGSDALNTQIEDILTIYFGH